VFHASLPDLPFLFSLKRNSVLVVWLGIIPVGSKVCGISLRPDKASGFRNPCRAVHMCEAKSEKILHCDLTIRKERIFYVPGFSQVKLEFHKTFQFCELRSAIFCCSLF
jgi:hypothetical protein